MGEKKNINYLWGGKFQTENFEKCEFYRGKIIEMVERIENPNVLASIYSFIMGLLSMKEKRETD